MSIISCFNAGQCMRKSFSIVSQLPSLSKFLRGFADTPQIDVTSKQVAVRGTENEERIRVRRARPCDVPKIMKYVRAHADSAWPGLLAPPPSSSIIVCDYVARTLAQGHSMLAEQMEMRRGGSRIRGLSLATALSPWDPVMLESFAKCVQCPKSRRFLHFAAHCMRAPRLHDKYRVHKILQVLLMVPPGSQNGMNIIEVLAKNSIIRGRDMGYPLLRFDVTDDNVANTLEEQLQLKNEWKLTYEILPYMTKEGDNCAAETEDRKKYFSVYTAFPQASVK